MTAQDTTPPFAPITAATTPCWCCSRRIGLEARRCRHCGVPQQTSRVLEQLGAMPSASASANTLHVLQLDRPARWGSSFARPASTRALLLSAVGLVTWCAMLAA